MGHDITFTKGIDYKYEDLAYQRFGAGNPNSHPFYKAIGCSNCDGGVSGNGNYNLVSLETLEEAKKEITTNEQGLDFINKVIKYLKDNKKTHAIISFM